MCPCHSGKDYVVCCKPFHDGKPAPTPLLLMRSRYSAFALKKFDYIRETATAIMGSVEELEDFATNTSFDGLTIIEAKANFVTFTAHLTRDGKDVSFTEKSRFEKIDGRWKYTNGITS